MARVFVYEGSRIPDPDPSKSADDIKAMMADFFHELENATHQERQEGEDTIIEFTKRVGNKGGARYHVVSFTEGEADALLDVALYVQGDGPLLHRLLQAKAPDQRALASARRAYDRALAKLQKSAEAEAREGAA